MRAELLLLSPSCLVPCLTHNGIAVWDTLAIGEYLNEIKPAARLLPQDRLKRARLLGERSMADAMYAPVVTRFLTYHIKLDALSSAYCQEIMGMPEMVEWIDAAKQEPSELEELEVEF